ncbi:MAG: DUF1576 domain-containing protein [Defluviitaleaceae bacterium]|nr:DUF1576 domain-containing protein [Defluviitaleaceae bacterium]
MARTQTWLQKHFTGNPYKVWGLLFFIFIIQGFIYATPREIAYGLVEIVWSPDVLVSDYIAIGGLGAAFVNAGLTGLVVIGILIAVKHEPYGLTLAVMGLIAGFSFFGKNPLNILPIIFGGYIYSRFARTEFKTCILPAVCATCLAPAVTKLAHIELIATWQGLIIGIVIGIFIGFIITPLSAAVFNIHKGSNLYNVGFAAGFIGIALFAFMQHLGVEYSGIYNRSSGYDLPLATFLAVASGYFVICGLIGGSERVTLKTFITFNPDDNEFYKLFGDKVYIAMGILGFACLALIVGINGSFSGTVIGGAMSVVGFGAFGKSLRRVAPVVAGTLAAALIHMLFTETAFNSPGLITVILFSTCLSPTTKRFGWKWAFVVGFVHLVLATNVGEFHGGLNLYNNGFAAGLSSMVLLPVMEFFKMRNENKTEYS